MDNRFVQLMMHYIAINNYPIIFLNGDKINLIKICV